MLHLPRLVIQLLLPLLLLLNVVVVDCCTVFLAGKNATKDGSVLVSHSNDGEFTTDPRLVKIPAADHPSPDAKRPVYFSPEDYPRYVGKQRGKIPAYYPFDDDDDDDDDHTDGGDRRREKEFEPIGYIPQVNHTYAYLEQTYGALNEHQVGIGESTCSGVFGAVPLGHPNGTALLSIDQLTQIAMERATSARQAITIMGELAEEYGFYGAGSFEGTAESLGVTDVDEIWIFHILPDPTGKSAIWAAQRLPDDHFAVIANMFVIRQVDPEDTDNFLMSDSVHDVAKSKGWWDEEKDGLLDFTKIYSDGEYAHKFYSGRRMWGAYHIISPSLDLSPEYTNLLIDPVYPVSAVPDRKLTVHDFFYLHRYYYQGTEYDLSKMGNLAGGPFGTPDRWKGGKNEQELGGAWERPIGLYRTSDTHVVQSRSWSSLEDGSGLGGVLWFGPSSALGTVFTPFVVGLDDVPFSFRGGHQYTFDRATMFWAACYVHNIANLKWSYMIRDVGRVQSTLERNSTDIVRMADDMVSKWTASKSSSYRGSSDDGSQRETLLPKEAQSLLLQNVQNVVATTWELSDNLIYKYADGFVNSGPNEDEMSQVVGYPSWWLEAVGYRDGPPPVPPAPPRDVKPSRLADHASYYHEGGGTRTMTMISSGKVAMKEHLASVEVKASRE